MDVSTLDIFDPDTYVDGPPHDAFAELRRTDPVHWQPMAEGSGCWAVLKDADVSHVAKHPQVFSASLGGVVVEDLGPEQLSMMRMMLLAMDPPGHANYRRPLVPHFGRQAIAALEGRVRAICQEVLGAVRDQGDVEFVHDVSAKLPSQVIGELFGIPREDWARIQRWAEMSTSTQDEELAGEDASGGSVEMAMYAIEFAAQRRTSEPVDDLTSLILGTSFGDAPMTDVDFGSFFVQLVTAGNDTTKSMLSSGLHALLTHPDQLADVRADPSLLPGAVEEILRWANPLHYFRRTAAVDTELSGTKIEAGQKVAMLYTSANRDEDVFAESQSFDIRRNPNPHLSFGIAEHFCLGVHLARLEGRIFFEELFATFPSIELTGDPVRVRSNLNNSFKRLPVRLTV
jgi:cytochrome P450